MPRYGAIFAICALVAAAPAPSSSHLDNQIPAIETRPPRGTAPGAAPTLVTSATTGITTHGPYTGEPTTTGAEQGSTTISATIPSKPNPTATYYNVDGKLTQPQPIPYMPGGRTMPYFFAQDLVR